MSIDDDETVSDQVPYDVRAAELQAMQELLNEAFAMTVADFRAKTAKDQNVLLFLMLRSQAGQLQVVGHQTMYLVNKLAEFEEKAKAMVTPEGIAEMTTKFMGGMSLPGIGRGF